MASNGYMLGERPLTSAERTSRYRRRQIARIQQLEDALREAIAALNAGKAAAKAVARKCNYALITTYDPDVVLPDKATAAKSPSRRKFSFSRDGDGMWRLAGDVSYARIERIARRKWRLTVHEMASNRSVKDPAVYNTLTEAHDTALDLVIKEDRSLKRARRSAG